MESNVAERPGNDYCLHVRHMISGAVPSTEFYTSKRYFQPPTLIHHFWIPTAFVESLQCCIISGSRRHSWNRSNVAEQPRPRIRAAAVIHSFQVQKIYMRLICKLHLSSAAPTEEAPFGRYLNEVCKLLS